VEILVNRSKRIFHGDTFLPEPLSDSKDYLILPLEVIFFDNLILRNHALPHDLQETIKIHHADVQLIHKRKEPIFSWLR